MPLNACVLKHILKQYNVSFCILLAAKKIQTCKTSENAAQSRPIFIVSKDYIFFFPIGKSELAYHGSC